MVWIDRGLDAATALGDLRGQIGALLSRARANLELGRIDRVLADVQRAEELCRGNPRENRVCLRFAKFLRAGAMVAKGDPDLAIALIDEVLREIDYPRQRVASQLAPMLILKARAELDRRHPGEALAVAREALKVAEANAPHPERSVSVGDALMIIARAQASAAGEPAQREVRFGDLDLSRPGDASTLYTRIRRAARVVCWTPGLLEVTARSRMKRCATEALARAVSDVDAPLLNSYYLARNPGSQLPMRSADAGRTSPLALVRAEVSTVHSQGGG